MKKSDYDKLLEVTFVGGGWIPLNQNAQDLADQSGKGEIHNFREVTARDLKFHNCYFSLLSFIYGYMPKMITEKVSNKNFYKWLKHLKKEYEVIFTYSDGTTLVEYESLAFGNMSQKRFEEYIRNQITWIFENVLRPVYKDDTIYNGITATIEEEYKKFLSKL
jgi:hypothetical protein